MNMSDCLCEIRSPRGKPQLIHRNYKFSFFIKDTIGGDQWRCTNRKCSAYILTHGEEGKRFITHSNGHHIHEPGENRKVCTGQRLTTTAKKIFPGVFEKTSKKSINAYVEKLNGLLPDDIFSVRNTMAAAKRSKRKVLLNKKRPFSVKNKVGSSDFPDGDESIPTDTEYYEVNESMSTNDAWSRIPEVESAETLPKVSQNFQDEFEIAGWSYGNNLRCLDHEQRIIAENLVSDIIFKGKLKKLTVNTKIL